MGTAPFGSLLAGSLAKIAGTSFTILIGGITCIIGAFFFYRKLPELKKILSPVYVRMGLMDKMQHSDTFIV
jgi:intracellular septation protein A